jgi:hypothetical protein
LRVKNWQRARGSAGLPEANPRMYGNRLGFGAVSGTLGRRTARAGWSIAEAFEDNGISGSKGRDQCPAFDRLHSAIAHREVDIVAWSVESWHGASTGSAAP